MRYIPTVEDNEWVTDTCRERGNQGIHCQRKFKEGVLMLEGAIDEWVSPALVHTVLTGADLDTYSLFLQQFKRRASASGILFEYKGATEADRHKGQHQHFMWVVESDSFGSLFDTDDAASVVSRTTEAIRRTAPAFNVYVCQPQRYSTAYVPLSDATLQDAACYLSYLFKRRSKEPGHRYMSSRKQCVQHRQQAQRISKPDSVSTHNLKINCVWRAVSPRPSVLHVAIHSSARHAHLFGNLGLSHASRNQRL